MLTFLYRLGWTAARPFAAPLSLTGGKLGRAIRGRRASVPTLAAWASRGRRPGAPLVWFHAASVGEGRQAEAVLRRARAARPGWQLAYTFSSPSAERLAASLPVDVAAYAPFDTVRDVAAALDAVRPTAIVFGATDIWPELARQAAARGVALGLVSATLAPTSSRRGAVARRLLKPAYAALGAVGAIDAADARELERLGVAPSRITLTGDTRHDSALARLAAADRAAPHLKRPCRDRRRRSADRPRRLHLAVRRARPAPRARRPALPRRPLPPRRRAPRADAEPPRRRWSGASASTWARMWRSCVSPRFWPLATWNHCQLGNLPSGNWDVVLVDRMGILAELYVAASVAYVGGGFHRAGLHSVIEPAAAGVPVLFGPRHGGSRDARLLLEAGRRAGGARRPGADGGPRALADERNRPRSGRCRGTGGRRTRRAPPIAHFNWSSPSSRAFP